MASEETWKALRHFTKEEDWGDPDAINDSLVMALDDFRNYIGCPIYITRGVADKGHSEKSYHYRSQGSCAVDIVCPEYVGHPIDFIFMAMRFGFSGIGYYPHWSWMGIKCGGLHLDVRPLGVDADGTLNYKNSLWMGIKVNGEQKYIDLNYANIIRNMTGGKDGTLT